jgi:phospholipid/cholesterol/gamma-HCH transport system permease protein
VCRPAADTLVLTLSGVWTREANRPAVATLLHGAAEPAPTKMRVEEAGLTRWDTTLLAFLLGLRRECRVLGAELDVSGLRPGVQALLRLATAVPEHVPPAQAAVPPSLVDGLGHVAIGHWRALEDTVHFVGECALAVGRAARGRAQFRRVDLARLLYACGPDALGIISLIGFLMGLILAFVGAIQLRLFGAQIYVANLAGIGIVREMGAIMTGVVMAGRSGAAFAAQLGTMQVNDEVDSLRTMGINPVEFLVFPRLLALTLMMPLLCLYADAMGVLGGGLVGVGLLDIGLVQYWNQTRHAIGLNDVAVGVTMSLVFGILVAVAGCLRGLRCGRNSAAVGRAATSAVVTGIVWIVVATALITVLCDVLGV